MFLRKFVYRTQKSSGIPSLSENCIQGGGQFKNSVQRGTGYSMSKILTTKKVVTIYCDNLLQNVTKVNYKMRHVFYYKTPQYYYKMQQLLQNASI